MNKERRQLLGYTGFAVLVGAFLWYWYEYIHPTIALNNPGYWGWVPGPVIEDEQHNRIQTWLESPSSEQLYYPNPGTPASLPVREPFIVPFVQKYMPPLDKYGWPPHLMPANFITSYQGRIYEPEILLADQMVSQNLLTPGPYGSYMNAWRAQYGLPIEYPPRRVS